MKTYKHSCVPALLVFTLTAMVACVIYLYVDGKIKEPDDLLIFMVGQLFTGWFIFLNYFGGTSRSSADKDLRDLNERLKK